MTPEQLYKVLAEEICDVCGTTSARREMPIMAMEWDELDKRWNALKVANREESWQPNQAPPLHSVK
jgi:hypothetical protein